MLLFMQLVLIIYFSKQLYVSHELHSNYFILENYVSTFLIENNLEFVHAGILVISRNTDFVITVNKFLI